MEGHHPTQWKNIQQWERITDRETVEHMLLPWQQLHFLQANETPLATPEWKIKLDDKEFQQSVQHLNKRSKTFSSI